MYFDVNSYWIDYKIGMYIYLNNLLEYNNIKLECYNYN